MQLQLLPDVLVGAVVLASIYVLTGLGWVIMFRSTRVLNFGIGQFLLLGAYLYWVLWSQVKAPFWVSLLGAMLIMAALSACSYYILLRPLAGQPPFSQLIVTLGASIVLASLIAIIFGVHLRQLELPFENTVFKLPGSAIITTTGIIAIIVSALVFASIVLFLRWSRWGIQMRAAAERPLLASHVGINIDHAFALGWALAGISITLAGIIYANSTMLSFSISELGLRGLAPALIGGFDSISGVVVGSITVAIVESLAVTYLGGDVQNAAVFTSVLIMLAVKPYGLFGSPEIRRV